MSNKLKRYAWLIETIKRNSRGISFREISSAWEKSSLNDGGESLSLRTFQEHKKAINDLSIGIEIVYQKAINTYHIQSSEDGIGFSAKWFWNAMSAYVAIEENKTIRNRIILEDIPSAEVWLDAVLHAIKENNCLKITYHPFGNQAFNMEVSPYFVQLAGKRWYLFGLQEKEMSLKAYALDRIEKIEITDKEFVLPKDFSAEHYLESTGIGQYDSVKEEKIVLRAYGRQVDLLRTLPLHKSQQETKTEKEQAEFTYVLRPTTRFYGEILSRGEFVKVLSPTTVRKKIKTIAEKISSYY
jgi:hypothetical protein